jgi:hypothetical protein
MEVTKWLKPSVWWSPIGDGVSVRVLTRDNPHLSEPKNDPQGDPGGPSNEVYPAPSGHQMTAGGGPVVPFCTVLRRHIGSRLPALSNP